MRSFEVAITGITELWMPGIWSTQCTLDSITPTHHHKQSLTLQVYAYYMKCGHDGYLYIQEIFHTKYGFGGRYNLIVQYGLTHHDINSETSRP